MAEAAIKQNVFAWEGTDKKGQEDQRRESRREPMPWSKRICADRG